LYQDRFFHVLRLTGDFDTRPNQTRRRECIRAAKRWTQMCYSDGRAAWAAVNGLKRKQCAAKECTCCVGTGVRIRCPQAKPVLRKCICETKRWTHMCCSDGRTYMGCSERTEVQTCGGFRILRSPFKLVRCFRIRRSRFELVRQKCIRAAERWTYMCCIDGQHQKDCCD